jgi:CDP-4-dehydro-6-deoxyglucose reductase
VASLISGTTHAIIPEIGLSAFARGRSQILVCARRALEDLEIDMVDFGSARLPLRKISPCRLDRIRELTPTVREVILRLPPATSLPYFEGQYINITGPNQLRRSYSIANATRPDGKLEFHLRKVEGGKMSEYWFGSAQPNDLLWLSGPIGTFFLRETKARSLVFLATGTGIAPVKAMLEYIARLPQDEAPRSIHVLWGGRTPADFYWDPAETGVPLRFVPVLSRPAESWRGRFGYIQDFITESTFRTAHVDFYACGSPLMIDSVRRKLAELGLHSNRFISDAFLSSDNAGS